ncbi:MAG: PHP domain-containing protein [Pyrinomonadaceae bacterium]
MNNLLTIKEDMHIHSNFSDGKHSVRENIEQAEARGLNRICCVDHVRRDTEWVQEFVDHIAQERLRTKLTVYAGIETKFLNTMGDFDLPEDIAGIDFIYAADHQFPIGDTFMHPREVRQMIAKGKITRRRAIEELCTATNNAMQRYNGLVIAHLFSILPKVGLDEREVPEHLLIQMAKTARINKVKIEIDERWKCPGFRAVSIFKEHGVPILYSTDSHRKETIGVYNYNIQLFSMLA